MKYALNKCLNLTLQIEYTNGHYDNTQRTISARTPKHYKHNIR